MVLYLRCKSWQSVHSLKAECFERIFSTHGFPFKRVPYTSSDS
jgi:hypothetical protein